MANRIRYWREKRGFTRRELAERAGTSEGQIVKLERGERGLTQKWLEILAPHLGVSQAALLGPETGNGHGQAGEPPNPIEIVTVWVEEYAASLPEPPSAQEKGRLIRELSEILDRRQKGD